MVTNVVAAVVDVVVIAVAIHVAVSVVVDHVVVVAIHVVAAVSVIVAHIDTVKSESPSSSGQSIKNDVVISFASMPAARWRLDSTASIDGERFKPTSQA